MSTATVPAEMYLPLPKQVKDLFGDLLGKEVTLGPGAPAVPSAKRPGTVAVYTDDQLVVRAVISMDMRLSAYAGSALALIGPEKAEEAVETTTLDETMTENLHEIFNIAAGMFNQEGSPHVRLYKMHAAGTELPHDARARTMILGRREDLKIEIGGYGEGRMSVVLC